MLVLVSTVFGAISGVGIWVVAGLISPAAISALIHTYVWGWAMEWVFFIVEIVAALVYYTIWDKISKGAHMMVGWVYFVAAYMSLVIINGIITFMLTPGRWLETHAFWDGFFNPTYWPRLLHFVFAGIGFSALVTAWWAVRRAREGVEVSVNTEIAGWAWRWALWTTVLQVVDGFILLMVLPQPVLRGIMSGGLATLGPLTAAILVGIGLLMMFSRATNPVGKPGLVTGTLAAMTLTIAVMSITRHQVRALYLNPFTAGSDFLVVPQWGNFLLFGALLLAGLATVARMVHRVLTSPASGADAA